MDLEPKPGEIVTDGKSVTIGAPVAKAEVIVSRDAETQDPRPLEWRKTEETSTWP